MWRFFVDESLPNTVVKALRGAGYQAESVREISLQGADDDTMFNEAQKRHAVLVTGDEDFTDVRRFPTGTHHGIIVVRMQGTKEQRAVSLMDALKQLQGQSLYGTLVIVELGRVCVRR
jgi:predicted nuclease of predicted toxin-antitoxin system